MKIPASPKKLFVNGNTEVNDTACHFDSLPNILFQYIFGFLNQTSFSKICLVSKRWNTQSSGNLIWKAFFIKHFSDSYPSINSLESQTNATFWKSTFRDFLKNIPAQKYTHESVLHRQKTTAIKILACRIFRATNYFGECAIVIEDLKTGAQLRNIVLPLTEKTLASRVIFDLQVQNEIIYAITKYFLWIIDQEDHVSSINIEEAKYYFKSFSIDEKFIYTEERHGDNDAFCRYDLITKYKTTITSEANRFPVKIGILAYGNKIFIPTVHAIEVFLDTGQKDFEYKFSHSPSVRIPHFTVHNGQLFACTKREATDLMHGHIIHIWDLHSAKASELILFKCAAVPVGLQVFDRWLLCGFSDSSDVGGTATVVIFDIKKRVEVGRFLEMGELQSFCFANNMLVTSTDNVQQSLVDPSYRINIRRF